MLLFRSENKLFLFSIETFDGVVSPIDRLLFTLPRVLAQGAWARIPCVKIKDGGLF